MYHCHKVKDFHAIYVRILIELTKDNLDFFRKFALDILCSMAELREE
jgi:hypothetical protein